MNLLTRLHKFTSRLTRGWVSGILMDDYSHDQQKRAELEAQLDRLNIRLAARAKLIEAELKVIGRQK